MILVECDSVEPAVGDQVRPLAKAVRQIDLTLPDFFNDTLAEEIMDLSVDDMVSAQNFVMKSMYDFDLDSTDGVNRLLELLPLLDPEIVKTIMQEIWPGYPVDSVTFDNSLSRSKIRGYLLDYLNGHGTEKADIDSRDETEPDGGAEFHEEQPTETVS